MIKYNKATAICKQRASLPYLNYRYISVASSLAKDANKATYRDKLKPLEIGTSAGAQERFLDTSGANAV